MVQNHVVLAHDADHAHMMAVVIISVGQSERESVLSEQALETAKPKEEKENFIVDGTSTCCRPPIGCTEEDFRAT